MSRHDTDTAEPQLLGVIDSLDAHSQTGSTALPDPPPGSPPRKRRRGGRIYSGCGTCRVRKIKCDERQPKCYNCERSRRYVCDGYGNNSLQLPQAPLEWMDAASLTDASFWEILQDIPAQEESHSPGFLQWQDGRALADADPRNLIPRLEEEHAQVQDPGQPTSPPTTMVMSSANQRLLHHYRTHVSQLMMPTVAPSQNPWLQLYLPLALQEPPTLPKQILLHAILAVAAFNKANLSTKVDKARYQKEGNEYTEKAASLLTSILDSESCEVSTDKTTRQTLMAAALTLTTAEVFSGYSKGLGYKYLYLCKCVVEITGGMAWWISDPTCLTLLQIFRCLRIVSSTSGWDEEVEKSIHPEQSSNRSSPASSSDVDDDQRLVNPPNQLGDYTLDITFGVSMKTLHHLNQTMDFSRLKCRLAPDEPWPSDKIPALLSLEDELFSTLEDPDAFTGHSIRHLRSQGMPSYIADIIKDNHVWAFHYSTTIFFRRALCGGSSEITPSIDRRFRSAPRRRPAGQELVSRALEHLENIDTLSRDTAVANTLWPGFIAAVEAVDTDLRHRALIWLSRAKRHGIGNISQATLLVMEVWRTVDRQLLNHQLEKDFGSDLGPVDWREVMREKNMYFMLT